MEILYNNLREGYLTLKEVNLNIPGKIITKKGIKNDDIKLISVSLIRCICVFTYIPQKHAI